MEGSPCSLFGISSVVLDWGVSTSRNQKTTQQCGGGDERYHTDRFDSISTNRINALINRCSWRKERAYRFHTTSPTSPRTARTAEVSCLCLRKLARKSFVYAKAKYGRYRYVTRPAGFFACESLEKTDGLSRLPPGWTAMTLG